MFRVGQRVICVDAANQGARLYPVKNGSIYTISSIAFHADWKGKSGPAAFLLELPEEICPLGGEATPFALSRFRPIVQRPTDISIFTAMLNPAREDSHV